MSFWFPVAVIFSVMGFVMVMLGTMKSLEPDYPIDECYDGVVYVNFGSGTPTVKFDPEGNVIKC